MIEILNHIFRSLQESEDAVRSIKKTLGNQTRFNRTVTTFALALTIYMIVQNTTNIQQYKKIEELKNEIEEFKRIKGE